MPFWILVFFLLIALLPRYVYYCGHCVVFGSISIRKRLIIALGIDRNGIIREYSLKLILLLISVRNVEALDKTTFSLRITIGIFINHHKTYCALANSFISLDGCLAVLIVREHTYNERFYCTFLVRDKIAIKSEHNKLQ